MGPQHQPVQEQPVEFAEDLVVTQMEIDVVDGKGNPLPRQLLCHTTLYDPAVHYDFKDPHGSPLFGLTLSPDTPSVSFPEGTGAPLPAGKPYRLLTMFKNPFDRPFSEVYLRLRLFVEPMNPGSPNRQPLQLMVACIGGCSEATWFPAPPGRSVHQEEFRFPMAGRIMLVTSHLHEYGKRLTLAALEGPEGTPRLIWEARPLPGQEFRTPVFRPQGEWRVSPQDRFRLSAEYDNPTDKDWPAMGAIGAFFVPDEPQTQAN